MTDDHRPPDGVIRDALDALADDTAIDWAALQSATGGDPEACGMLDALQAIARVARAHAPVRSSVPTLPFRWGLLEVQVHLARGAHGDVFRARDPRLDRDVALKLLGQDEDDAATPVAITEGRLLARVRHANVVAVYGADRIDGQAGLWMELVEGETLHECLVARGPLPAGEVIDIGVAVCAGLAAVHAAGLVHRDVKAQNVMREHGGRTLLMDLGAGAEAAGPRTRIEGTPLYLAPELLEGGRATVASDVYAVGVLLHVLSTGRYPAEGQSIDDLRAHHRAARRISVARDRVPAGLATIIERAIAPRPADRYPTATAMQHALIGLARPAPWRQFVKRLTVAAALTVAIGGGLALVAQDQAPRSLAPRSTEDALVVALPPYAMGPLSADGRFVPYVDGRGDVHRFDVATRRTQTVVRADDGTGRATSALLSHDGSRIAYAWRRPDGMDELRAAAVGAGTAGIGAGVLLPPRRGYVPIPLDWSADAPAVLCALAQYAGALDVVLANGEIGASPRRLLSSPGGGRASGALSADGRVAAIAIEGGGDADGLHLVDTLGGVSRRVVDGHATLPRFSADGRQLFFVRDAARGSALWSLSLVGGVPAGAPIVVQAQIGGVHDVRVTGEGVLHRMITTGSAEVYTAAFDALGSDPPRTPTRIDPDRIGNHVGPAWAPDGGRLAYFAIRHVTPGLTPERTLTIRDMATGDVRSVFVPLAFLGGYTPRWSPDGRHVAVWGRDGTGAGSWGYFRVDVETGATTLLVRLGINAPAYAQFSPDGRAFLYTDPRRGIVSRNLASGVHDLVSGREVVLVPVQGQTRPGRFSLSRDGASLAFVRLAGPDDARTVTLEVQRPGERPLVRARATAPDWLGLQAWTPDDAHLLYSTGRNDEPGSVWRIGVDAGGPVDLRFRLLDGPNAISLHPDGRRIAYAERLLSPELWVSRLPPR